MVIRMNRGKLTEVSICLLCRFGAAAIRQRYLRVRRGGYLLLAGLSIGLIYPGVLSAQEKVVPLERIVIRRGEAEAQFILKESRSPFFVKGFNYIRLRAAEGASAGDHSTFDADTRAPALLPTLLGLECQNEACLHARQWPFTGTNGVFAAANGKIYHLSRTDERQALMDEGYRYYHGRIVEAVKAVDAETLVAEGVFVPRAVGKDSKQHAGVWPGKTGDDRYPPTLTTIGRGKLDFLDVHFYRTGRDETVDQAFRLNLGSTGFFTPEMVEVRKAKPVIMGEFGAFMFVEKTFEKAVDAMVNARDLALKERVNGLLYWTYDSFEQPELYPAATDWALFVQKMGSFEANTGAVPVQR